MKKHLKDFLNWIGKGIYQNKEFLGIFVLVQFVEIKNITLERFLLTLAWIVFWGANKVIHELKENK